MTTHLTDTESHSPHIDRHDSRALRNELIPLPPPDSGYARVMLVGTTGAGKTTLLRHLIGTDPHHDRFPSTSTAKTTTADIEIITADAPYQAVVTFAPRAQVEADVDDCLYEACERVVREADSPDPARVAAALLEHREQRFRLSYILGAWDQPLPDQDDDDGDDFGDPGDSDEDEELADEEVVSAESVRQNNAALHDYVRRIIALAADQADAIGIRYGSYSSLENENQRTEWLAEHFSPTLRADHDYLRLIDDIMRDITRRFDMMSTGAFSGVSSDDWQSHWYYEDTDRDAFLRQVRWFSSNHHKQFGRLLTPLVDGIRVRGPLYPAHPKLREIRQPLVVIDGEGLGHSAREASSISTRITDRFAEVDLILLVDNAQQPMQAAPLKLIESVGSAGYSAELAVAFTHFDQVKGANLKNDRDRVNHVRASVSNALGSLRAALTPRVSETLQTRLDEHGYYLGALDKPTSRIPSGYVNRLADLFETIRIAALPPLPTELAPTYRLGEFNLGLNDAVEDFCRPWRARLGLQSQPDIEKEHWARIKALCRRFAELGENEYKHLRPVADLMNHIQSFISLWLERPQGWNRPAHTEKDEQEAIDGIRQSAFRSIHDIAERRLWDEHDEDWIAAYNFSGTGSTRVRADHMMREIYMPAAPIIGFEMDDEMRAFLDEIVTAVQDAIEESGGYLENTDPPPPRLPDPQRR